MNTRKSALACLGIILATSVGCTMSEREPAQFGSGESIERARVDDRIETASRVYRRLLTAPDGGVPEQLLKNAQCVAVLPGVLKAAFIAGGRYGKGVITCKEPNGDWSAPAFITLSGGSVGWQIGAESTDLVLFFTGEAAKQSVVKPSDITLGADLSVAAGPVGRKAEAKTNFSKSGAFSYAASEGLFAGVSLEGAVMSSDREANREYYGRSLNTTDIVIEQQVTSVPQAANAFISLLPRG